MALVQVEPKDMLNKNKMELDEVKIVWDEEINQIMRSYGRIVIDYIKGLFLEHFSVRIEHALC
ncbi:MAG: hypothetical protein ACMUJM_13125 [bacterium]